MKYLLLILNLCFFLAPATAQSIVRPDTSQHFLWFSGHWSTTKKNTFIFTGSPLAGTAAPSTPSGGSVTVSSDGSVQISGPGVDAWNKRLDEALQSEQQFIQQLDNPQDNLNPSTRQLHQLLEPEAQQRVQDLEDLKISPNQNILTPDTKPSQSPPTTINQLAAQYCQQVKADYDEVISYWKAHARDKMADLTYPAPPTFEYACYACDSGLRHSTEQAVDQYVHDFFKEEREHVAKALGILGQMDRLGFDQSGTMDENTYNELFANNKKDPSKSAPCAYMSLSDLSQAVMDITLHAYYRADKMMRDNRKNFKAAAAVCRTWLSAVRNLELLTGNTQDEADMPELAPLVGRAVEYYTDKFRHNDWSQIANLTYILSLMRDEALLGANNDQNFQDYLARLERVWNGFKLTIEMDIKIGKNGGYRIAHLKGEGHVIPAFERDSNQCYKWVVADENSMDALGFYNAKSLPGIDCNLIDNEIVTPPQAPKMTYIGTKKYTVLLQNLTMNFCNPGHDTIMLTGFSPNPAAAGLWQVPYSGQVNLGVNGMEQYFEDINAKKKLAGDGEAQKGVDDMKRQAEQLKAQMEAMKAQMTGSQAGANYEKMMEMANKARSLSTTAAVGKMIYLDFLLPVKNNDPVLVDKKYDAKEINPAESQVIVYGYYTIHIENDGNGKAKTPPNK